MIRDESNMSNLSDRIESLSPEKRALLAKRLQAVAGARAHRSAAGDA